MKRREMPLEAAIEIAEDYVNPEAHCKVHTYGEIRGAIKALIANAKSSIPQSAIKEEPQLEGQMNIHDYGI